MMVDNGLESRLKVFLESRLMVLMFTDLVGSVDLKMRVGASVYANLISRHDALFRKITSSTPGGEILKDTGDGFLVRFATAADAVGAALRFQYAIHVEPWEPEPIRICIGVHIGQVVELEKEAATGLPKLVGLAVDVAARIMSVALPSQTLMTRTAFDDARQYVLEHPAAQRSDEVPKLRWVAHGPYLFKGSDEPIEVFEVGAKGIAPLRPPPDGEKLRRAIPAGEEELYGWRPGVGLPIPQRGDWLLQRKIGEGGFGEIWLAKQDKTGIRRVFKFCFDAQRLRSLKRELILFRLMREALGDRPDIAQIRDIQLKRPPFYLESEFTDRGNLVQWAESQGGIDRVPLATRLDLVIRMCDAVAAAHSIGILHKDIRPSIILIYYTETDEPRPRLSDFGIGVLTDRSQLERRNITMTGMTQTSTSGDESDQMGEGMYAPPESWAHRPFTIQGDVYALGVLLYQMIVGDLTRPLAQGWEADVPDPLHRDDIACCVAGRPEQRLASAQELGRRLSTLHSRRKASRQRTLLRTLAAACVILLIVLIPAAIVGGFLASGRDLGQPSADERLDEMQRAQVVNEFLTDSLLATIARSTQMGNAQDDSMRDMLDVASERIEQDSKLGGMFHEQPLVEASIRATSGIAYWKLGEDLLARRHLDRARSLWRRELGADDRPTLSPAMQQALAEYEAVQKRDAP
ncbi:MAG: protein kinase [Phycisphaerales bacterium]